MANAYKGLAGCPGLGQELYLIILITGLRGSIIIIISTRGEEAKTYSVGSEKVSMWLELNQSLCSYHIIQCMPLWDRGSTPCSDEGTNVC